MVEHAIMKYMLHNKAIYTRYYNYINVQYIKTNYKDIYKVLLAIDKYYTSNTEANSISLSEIEALVLSMYPMMKDSERQLLSTLLRTIESSSTDEYSILGYLKEHRNRAIAGELALVSFDVSEGRKSLNEIDSVYEKFELSHEQEDEDFYVTDNLAELLESVSGETGLRWRLPWMNRALGSLRKGDFGFFFARPESFSRDTEVLTPTGWLTVDKVTTDTLIAQVDKKLKTSFVKPLSIHPHEQTHCYHIHDTLGRVDLIVTEGHTMIYEEKGKLIQERADTVKYYQGRKHHVAAKTNYSGGIPFLPEHRLLIAYQADGHTRNYKEYGYTFSFKKTRKIERLKKIIKTCGYECSTYKDGNRGHTGFYVKSQQPLQKDFSWVDLSKISVEWAKQFIEELSYWDATRRTETRFKFDTTNQNVANTVQAIAVLAGYNCLLSKFIDERSPTYNDIYSLSIRTNYTPVDGQCIIKERIPFTDTTYCFKVPTGMLLVRRKGAVAVCGNTGKTTWLASEVTHFAEQTEKPILWCNNEEGGNKVKIRCYQAALGITFQELKDNFQQNRDEFLRVTGDRIKIYDDAAMTRRDIEARCKELQPSLIILDQIDKIKGFSDDRYDLQMKAIYQWARELAKRYGAVIGICQAGSTAEGKKWLTMNDVDSSHTAKQGEADFIVGIGKSHEEGMGEVRFLNISKNKLLGDSETMPDLRHGKVECLIKADIARYEEV